MSCGIYKITNKITNHAYIGQSITIEERWNDEINRAFNPNSESYSSPLSSAIRKYGKEQFTFEILEECTRSKLDEKEIYYINFYNTYFDGYNCTTGGQGTPNAYVKITPEQLFEIYDLLQNTNIPQKEIAKRYNVGQDIISTINNGKSRRMDGYTYPLRNNKNPIKYCPICGVQILFESVHCNKCAKISQMKAIHPSREELKNMIRTMSFTQIGKKYGVADNTIRKWCRSVNLPTKKQDIKSFSDKEWQNI